MSNPVVLEYSQLCGHHHEQTEDAVIPRKRSPGTMSVAPLPPTAPTTARLHLALWVHLFWTLLIHGVITRGLRARRLSQSLTTLLRLLHIVLRAGPHVRLPFGIQSWWWSMALSVIRVGSPVRPPEGGVAPGTGWAGLPLQSWAGSHCGLVQGSGLIPASQPTH